MAITSGTSMSFDGVFEATRSSGVMFFRRVHFAGADEFYTGCHTRMTGKCILLYTLTWHQPTGQTLSVGPPFDLSTSTYTPMLRRLFEAKPFVPFFASLSPTQWSGVTKIISGLTAMKQLDFNQ